MKRANSWCPTQTQHLFTAIATLSTRLQAEDFPRFALHRHFKRAATDLAIGDELLRRNGSIDLELETLPAKRAANVFGAFHGFGRIEEG